MTNRAPSIISGLLTFVLVILISVAFVFGQIVLLNGVSESKAFNALSIAVVCQSVGLLFAVILARWLPNFLITKFNMNAFLTVIIAVIAAVGLGALLSFLAIIVGTLATGIK